MEGRAWRCSTGHSFDIARSGYVNLLQPHDRRSRAPGDPKAVVDARARLAAAGMGRVLIEAVRAMVRPAGGPPPRTVVELGSGCGDALASLAREYECGAEAAVGLDLSSAAVDLAARRFPGIRWVVANADRRLPLRDACADLVVSLHARRNPAECARLLTRSGRLLVATPAPDDLIELRAAAQGEGVERPRVNALVTEHASHFDVVSRSQARERGWLAPDVLRDLLLTTYRGGRRRVTTRTETLQGLHVTQASDLVLFALR